MTNIDWFCGANFLQERSSWTIASLIFVRHQCSVLWETRVLNTRTPKTTGDKWQGIDCFFFRFRLMITQCFLSRFFYFVMPHRSEWALQLCLQCRDSSTSCWKLMFFSLIELKNTFNEHNRPLYCRLIRVFFLKNKNVATQTTKVINSVNGP